MKMIIDSSLEVKLYTKEPVELPGVIKKRFSRAQSIYQPESTHDLQWMYSYAQKNKLSVVPRGAATSNMGSIIPLRKSMIADLTHLKRILDFDKKDKTIIFEAGLRWWELKHFLKKYSHDLYTYPTSLFSTVGGWLSTGGYGINSFKYGHISNFIDSIEVVTPDKTSIIGRSDRKFKYFIGTEGQMGIINRVKLKVRESKLSKSFLIYFKMTSQAVEFLSDILKSLKPPPVHISYFDRHRLEHKNLLLNGKVSFPQSEGVLMTFESSSSKNELLKLVERKKGIVAEDYLSSFLWNERYFPFSVKKFYPSILGCEAILPLEKLDHYITMTRKFGDSHDIPLSTEATLINEKEAVVFTIFPSDSENIIYILHLFLTYSLNNIAMRCGGKPYGIGIWNLPLLKKRFSDKKLKEYRQFKKEQDPLNLINPAKSFSKNYEIKYLLRCAYAMSTLFSNGISLLKPFSKILSPDLSTIKKGISETESCANCGACTLVCPSHLMNSNEIVTAKGKLFILKQLLENNPLPKSIAQKAFQCLHCHLCEYVCQSKLTLTPVWEKLESLLEKKFGRPEDKIERFIKQVESHPAYTQLFDSFGICSNNKNKDLQNV
ncbi:MAG: FAD-binding protein [Candidatus Aminicenantaceae bacterium]